MKKAIVFGTGNYFRIKEDNIREEYEIIGFIDSRVEPGEEWLTDDILTINPKDVHKFPQVPIIIMSVKFFDMWRILIQMGIDENRIVFGIHFNPSYDTFECVMNENGYNIRSVDNHLEIYSRDFKCSVFDSSEFEKCIRDIYHHVFPVIDIIKNFPTEPVSRRFGREHGTPIDRYYIEKFLFDNRDKIHGDVAEFANNMYTIKFGSDVINSYVLHVNGWGENVICANLVTGEGIRDNMVDCLICTQTIQFIYDIDSAIRNIYRMLKPGGYALITAHGISQISMYDYRNWGEYWRFTDLSLKELLRRNCKNSNIKIQVYGNMQVVIAWLLGLTIEDISCVNFEVNDNQYQLVNCVCLRKGETF